MKTLLRFVRTSVAAARHFSVEATAVVAATKPAAAEGRSGSPTTTSKGGRDTLGRRLLSLVYAKRSAVITIRKWKEEGHAVRKYELNRVVRELRKLRRYKHALEVCEWMRIQDDIHLLSGDYAVQLDLIAKVRGMNSAEKFFEDIPDKMKDHATCSALLHCYVQQQDSVKAEALMEKMSECGFVKHPLPYNHMLSLYISTGQLEKIPAMILELKKNTSPDLVSYNLWLAVCASLNDVETAEKIFLELKKAKIDPDWVTFSTLTSIYIRSSHDEKAASTLREMERRVFKRTRVAFPSLISLYTSLKNKSEVYRVWKKMKSIFHKLNDSEYTCMISSLLKLDEFEEALNTYTEWESVSVTKDTRISNLILAAYVNKNQLDMAEDFKEKMVQKGIPTSYTTWEVLTWGYMKHKKMNGALDSFKKAVNSVKKWDPDVKMVQEMFSILGEQGNVELAEDLLVTLRRAGHVNTEIYNSLLRTYMKAGKMPLIVAERMKKDNVRMDTETQELIKLTSKMCVAEVPNHLS